jgi:hypothetical protein
VTQYRIHVSASVPIIAVLTLGVTSRCTAMGTSHAAGNAPKDEPVNITQEMLKADPRLESHISIKSRRISISDFALEVTRQTGIAITTGERDGSGDEEVAIFCANVPAYRMLNGLWSTMSYKGGSWSWRRTGQPGAYRYQLKQPAAARSLRQRLRDEVQQKLERDTERLMNSIDGSDDEKAAALKDIFGEPEKGFEAYYAFSKDRVWADIRSFKEALTPIQRAAVLRGDTQVIAPLSVLSATARDYYYSVNKVRAQKARDAGKTFGAAPQMVRFSRTKTTGTPALLIDVPNATSGQPVVGGIPLTLAFWDRIKPLWRMEGDSASDSAEDRIMKAPTEALPDAPKLDTSRLSAAGVRFGEPASFEGAAGRLALRLEEISVGADVPLIARLAQDNSMTGLSSPWGASLKEYWKQLWRVDLMEKWRDGVQLVSVISWPLEDPPVPGWMLRQFRKDAKPGTLLPLTDITLAADQLTKTQLMRTVFEFPTMRDVATYRGPLAFIRRFPTYTRQAESPQGLILTSPVVSALRPLFPAQLMAPIDAGEARFLTIAVENGPNRDAPRRDVTFAFRDAEGRIIRSLIYTETPQPKLKKD